MMRIRLEMRRIRFFRDFSVQMYVLIFTHIDFYFVL